MIHEFDFFVESVIRPEIRHPKSFLKVEIEFDLYFPHNSLFATKDFYKIVFCQNQFFQIFFEAVNFMQFFLI